MAGRSNIVDCVCSPGVCPKTDPCPVRRNWIDINNKIRDVLAGVTLKDIAGQETDCVTTKAPAVRLGQDVQRGL